MLQAAIFSQVRMTGEDVIRTWKTVLTFSLLALITGQIEVQARQKTHTHTKNNTFPFFFACMQICSYLYDLRLELGCSSERTARTNTRMYFQDFSRYVTDRSAFLYAEKGQTLG